MGLEKILHQYMSLNAIFIAPREPALALCDVEEKLSADVVRANKVVGTDVKALESIHLTSHCQEAKLLQSGSLTCALYPKAWDFMNDIVLHS